MASLRQYFEALPDLTEDYCSHPLDGDTQHLFTDGSSFAEGRVELHQAAWAVFNHTSGLPVAGAPLHGLPQTIGRAELCAFVSALRWSCTWRASSHIWVDAQFVHEGFQARLQGYITQISEKHADLWLQVDQLIVEGAGGLVDSSWIPSHLDPQLCTSPFEEWVAAGNNRVDQMAVQINHQRPAEFQDLKRKQVTWDDHHVQALTRLRSYYLELFEATKADKSSSMAMTADDSDDDTEGALYSFTDVYISTMDSTSFVQSVGFPFAFWQAVYGWVIQHESDSAPSKPVSFIEVAFGLLKFDAVRFPFRDPGSGEWTLVDRFSLFERPTFAYFLGIIQKVFKYVGTTWTLHRPLVSNLNRSCIGVMNPQAGILLRLAPDLLERIQMSVAMFTKHRPIRRACDLARPIA